MNKKAILYIFIAIAILALIIMTFFPGMIFAFRDSGILGDSISNSVEDKCTPPQGYTEESWRTHMSHHPDIYKECLT